MHGFQQLFTAAKTLPELSILYSLVLESLMLVVHIYAHIFQQLM